MTPTARLPQPDLGPDRPDVPEQTSDDTDAGWGEAEPDRRDPHEQWLREQRPPHWD